MDWYHKGKCKGHSLTEMWDFHANHDDRAELAGADSGGKIYYIKTNVARRESQNKCPK